MRYLLQIDSEDREFLLVALREKRLGKLDRLMELKEEAQKVAAEVRECDAKIARYSATALSIPSETQHTTSPAQVLAAVTTDGGRVKRGESSKLIAAKLAELNGAGATTWDLVNSTGTKYSTVRRVLLDMQQNELAVERDGRWHYCHALARQHTELENLSERERNEEGEAMMQVTAAPSQTDAGGGTPVE